MPLTVTRIWRVTVAAPAPGQPTMWTLVDFTADDTAAEPLADALSTTGGWYDNYTARGDGPDALVYVVFPGLVHRYRRGDAAGRRAAVDHGLALGIPAAQLDWTD